MNEAGREWADGDDDDGADASGSWLRPVWEDDEEELDAPLLRRPTHAPALLRPTRATSTSDALLAPLAGAAAALARLDAAAEAASPAVQQGLIARLTYAEAAGWLAGQGLTAHPVSLALRDRERVGRRELWLQHTALRPRRSVPAWEQDDAWLEADDKITRALALARLLQRLPAADNPLVDAARAESWLASLAPQAGAVRSTPLRHLAERLCAGWAPARCPPCPAAGGRGGACLDGGRDLRPP
jgi:hypothetical protein